MRARLEYTSKDNSHICHVETLFQTKNTTLPKTLPKAITKTNTVYIIVQPQIESQLNSSQGTSISRGLHVCEEYKDHPNPANKWIISNHFCKNSA
jgi:hypothetical protein